MIQNELTVTLIQEENMSLRELENTRKDFAKFLEVELISEPVEILELATTRSLDPIIVGTIAIAILPNIIDKIGDAFIKWIELNKNPSMTITSPLKDGTKIILNYNPHTTTKEQIKKWFNSIKH